jgi:spore maturation protein CgeB
VGPFRPGEHLATARLEDLAEAIAYYLAHEGERQRMAENAYEFVTRTLTMGRMARQIVAALGL